METSLIAADDLELVINCAAAAVSDRGIISRAREEKIFYCRKAPSIEARFVQDPDKVQAKALVIIFSFFRFNGRHRRALDFKNKVSGWPEYVGNASDRGKRVF